MRTRGTSHTVPSHPIRPHVARGQTADMESTKTVSRRVAATIIGIAPDTLKKWAGQQRGPRIAAKLGESPQAPTLYSVAEIERWRRDPVKYEQRHRGPGHASR